MLDIRLLRLLVYIAAVSLVARPTVVTIDVSEAEIENIGNDVKRNFDEEGFNNQQPLAKLALPSPLNAIANPLPLQTPLQTPGTYLNKLKPERKHRPTVDQIRYLIENKNNPAPGVLRRARVVLTGPSGVNGLINLKQIRGGPVLIFGTIRQLPRSGAFGFHFHELPVSGDCESAGEHFNPGQMAHGGKDSFIKHAGDLGNVVAANGVAHVVLTSDSITLVGSNEMSVLGRSLVIHANHDDLGTLPNRESRETGNSGWRLACGTVELLPPVLTPDNRLN